VTHHPAYWLSREPAEAADFLARTAVASRIVGGFVKKAEGESSWLTPDMQRVLTHGAIGAGIGGAGGLGMGLFSKRKKNPLATALTGAAIGGVLGGAGPEIYEGIKGQANKVPTSPNTPQSRQAGNSFKNMSGFRQGLYKALDWTPPVDTGPTPTEQMSPEQKAKADTTWGDIAGKTTSETVKGTADVANAVKRNYPLTAAAHAGILAGQVGYHHRVLGPAQRARDFLEGAPLLDKGPATTTAVPGATVTRTPNSSQATLAQELATHMSPRATATGLLRGGVVGQDWRAGQAGRQLEAIATRELRGQGGLTSPVPGYHGGVPTTATINDAVRRGTAQRLAAAKALGAGSKIGGGLAKGLMYLGPHALPYVSKPFMEWAESN
jgi:hypothetical protein